MKGLRLVVVALILSSTLGASAASAESRSQSLRSHAPKGITETFYACLDKADSHLIDAAYCLTEEHTRQDKRLNADYKKLLGKLKPEARQALVHDERAWLKLQETTGRFENYAYGSEMVDNLQLSQNELFRICQRADTLEDYLFVVDLQSP